MAGRGADEDVGGSMKVLVACEESQMVCIAFRENGHEAYSCDILEPSGGHPEWHIQCDVIPLLNGNCVFKTLDGAEHGIDGRWDMIIAHPPCTYLTLAGNKWFNPEFEPRFPDRRARREEAVEFFMKFANADCERIVIENPVCIMSSRWRKPDQYIEPFMFGDAEKKKTGLWLKGVPPISATSIVEPVIVRCKSGANEPRWHMETMHLPKDERSRARSKTFPGIARAMAEQWGGLSDDE